MKPIVPSSQPPPGDTVHIVQLRIQGRRQGTDGAIGLGSAIMPLPRIPRGAQFGDQIRQPTPVRKQMSAPSRLTSIRSTSNWKTGLFGLEPRSGRLLQIHVQGAPSFPDGSQRPPPHQAAFATEDPLFIACK
jgi:hypothetical protein